LKKEEGRREKGEGRREKGEGRRVLHKYHLLCYKSLQKKRAFFSHPLTKP